VLAAFRSGCNGLIDREGWERLAIVLEKSTSKNISTPLIDVGSLPNPSCTSALVINTVSKVVVLLPEWVEGGNSKKIEEEGAELNAKV
jgi:hypothetical protein